MILVIRRNLQVTAFTWLVDSTMDSFIEAVANPLRIHGDDFHVCSSQFPIVQAVQSLRFVQSVSGYRRFQGFQSSKPHGSSKFKSSTFNDHTPSDSSRFSGILLGMSHEQAKANGSSRSRFLRGPRWFGFNPATLLYLKPRLPVVTTLQQTVSWVRLLDMLKLKAGEICYF